VTSSVRFNVTLQYHFELGQGFGNHVCLAAPTLVLMRNDKHNIDMIDAQTLLLLFDPLPDTVFFAKDREGRYVLANRTLLHRLGMRDLHQLLGRTAADVFPHPLGNNYLAQDLRMIATGTALIDELECHLFPNHASGWCLTRKFALSEAQGVTGLVGISRDIGVPSPSDPTWVRLKQMLNYTRKHLDQEISVAALAVTANLSVAQLERHFHKLFQLTPRAWLLSLRLEQAMQLLQNNIAIAAIAMRCGFSDHSAFSRAFRRHIGLSPSEYQTMLRENLDD
jgi:AraC-like DNA-binding protein